jgi:hypothetical protein
MSFPRTPNAKLIIVTTELEGDMIYGNVSVDITVSSVDITLSKFTDHTSRLLLLLLSVIGLTAVGSAHK